MKFFSSTGLTILAAFVCGIYLPWWSISLAALTVALLIPQTPVKAFFSGFLGCFALWAGIAGWIDLSNHHILSSKVSLILPLGGSSALLLIITGIIAGLVGGLSALCGSFARHRANN